MDRVGQNSIQNFMSHMQQNPPAYSSLYHVQFNRLPQILIDKKLSNDFNVSDGAPLANNLSYYANEVSIPSRQITTGEQKAVGTMYRYPTSTTFSEISMQFTLTRNMLTRTFFERWMNYISNDASQYVIPYDICVVPEINIWKLERGGGAPISKPGLRAGAMYNQVTAVWRLYNVFPFNISSFNLSNAQSNLINMEVTFYYERYRFYKQGNIPGPAQYDIDGNPPAAQSITPVPTLPQFQIDNAGIFNQSIDALTGTNALQQRAQFNINGQVGDFSNNQLYGSTG